MNIDLVKHLTAHELNSRYKGSLFGLSWALFVPAMMLAVYTFVFGFVFKAKWNGSQSSDPLEFALFLFCGLVPYLFVSDALGKAPSIIVSSPHLVKKVVFPLPLLIVSSALAAAVHTLISLGILIAFSVVVKGSLSLTAFLPILILIPLLITVIGLSLILSSAAVYFRDTQQMVMVALPVLMFISPVFYPVSAVPAALQTAVRLNPLSMVIEQMRNTVVLGSGIDWNTWSLGLLGSFLILTFGYFWFKRLATGFADVL